MNFTDRDRKIIESTFQIQNKDSQTIRFKFNYVQDKFWKEMTHRNLILKARQEGFSTLVGAMCLEKCSIYDDIYAALISHETETTERMLSRTNKIISSLPGNVPTNKDNTKEKEFTSTRSRYFIGTAGQRAFGRGDTLHIAHLSEPPYYPDQTIIDGIFEAVPESGYIFAEFTANGTEKMYEMVMKSIKGENEWKLHFFPWYAHKEYSKTASRDFKCDGNELRIIDYGKEYGYQVTYDQLEWRRWKLSTMASPELFPQEYPSCIDEAFMLAGQVYFDKRQLGEYRKQCRKPLKVGYLEIIDRDIVFHQADNGIFQFWELPVPGESYIMAPDTADGKGGENADFSVACVLRRSTKNFVATLSCQYEPDKFAKECYTLGKLYNSAIMAPESNKNGGTVINELNHMKYPKMYMQVTINKANNQEMDVYGFDTKSQEIKYIVINVLAKNIRLGYCGIPDIRVITECSNFIKDDHGKLHAAGKGHDDLVISSAICLWVNENIPGEPSLSEISRMKREWEAKTRQ